MQWYSVGPDDLEDYAKERVDTNNYEWCVYYYETPPYEGRGKAVFKDYENKYKYCGLGHCSCYGPLEPSWRGTAVEFHDTTLESILATPDNIFDDDYPAIRDKVRELNGCSD